MIDSCGSWCKSASHQKFPTVKRPFVGYSKPVSQDVAGQARFRHKYQSPFVLKDLWITHPNSDRLLHPEGQELCRPLIEQACAVVLRKVYSPEYSQRPGVLKSLSPWQNISNMDRKTSWRGMESLRVSVPASGLLQGL
jgi:hypothetical protein